VYEFEDFEKIKGAVIEGVWRRAAGMLDKMRWIGISLFCVEFGFHFKLLNFMIALAKKLSAQKKTVSGLCGRRSSALANPSDFWFWLFKSLHFATPNH
jgi:hypothetical protein